MKPTEAQVRFLLRHWIHERPITVSRDWHEATSHACIRKGFITANGAEGKFPSGAPFDEYDLTPEAFIAIGRFFAGRSALSKDGE